MFATVEVRWFLKGAIPPGVMDWYQGYGDVPEAQPPRVDYYLPFTAGDSLGVKLREGRLEIKQRYSQPEVFHFGKRAAGRVAHWGKWGFELARTGAGRETVPSEWIGVRKERTLRMFHAPQAGKILEVSAGGSLDGGCGWEIAKVSLDGAPEQWWSVGFEAFGLHAELWETMLSVANHFLSNKRAPALVAENSYGYPRWLQFVAG